jgi:hypothetical protein
MAGGSGTGTYPILRNSASLASLQAACHSFACSQSATRVVPNINRLGLNPTMLQSRLPMCSAALARRVSGYVSCLGALGCARKKTQLEEKGKWPSPTS